MNVSSSLSFFIILALLIPIILVMLDILQIDEITITAMLVFWGMMLYVDISFTIKNKKFIKYESSFVLSFFAKKMKLFYAVLLTILCEITIVILSPFVFVHNFDVQIIGIVSCIVGIIHIDGLYKTRKFINAHNTL